MAVFKIQPRAQFNKAGFVLNFYCLGSNFELAVKVFVDYLAVLLADMLNYPDYLMFVAKKAEYFKDQRWFAL